MDAEAQDWRFLGCTHERYTTTAVKVQDLLNNHPLYHPRTKGGSSPTDEESTDAAAYKAQHFDPKRKAEVVVYSMERFATKCITVFCGLTGYDRNKIGTAPTPFIDESKDPLIVI